MENIMDTLKLAELKKESIRSSFDQAHAQASSILLFTLQWKDIEDQFELAKNSLLKQAQELTLKEKKWVENSQIIEQRDQEVEVKLNRVRNGLDELQMKEKQLGSVNKLLEKCILELNSKEKQLNLAQKQVEDCIGMHGMKREQLGFVQKELEECNKELSVKSKQLGMVQKSMEECSRELESKEIKLGVVRNRIEESCKEFHVKNEQLEGVQKELQVYSKELETKGQEVEKVKILAANCDNELEMKQKELDAVKNLICDCCALLNSKEKQLEVLQDLTAKCSGDLDLKKIKLGGVEESIDHCLKEFDLKKKELDATQKMIEERLKEINLKEKELDRLRKEIEERSIDLVLKEIHLDSIKLLIGEHMEELEAKEKQYHAMKKLVNQYSVNLALKEKELDLIDQSIRKNLSKLQSEEKKLSFKETELCIVQGSIGPTKVLIKDNTEELEAKQCDAVKKSFNEGFAKLTEMELIKQSISNNLSKLEPELELIGEKTEKLEAKEMEYDEMKKSVTECSAKIMLKETELELIEQSIRKQSSKLESTEKKLHFIQKLIVECTEKLESKNKNLDLVGKSLKECCDKLASKEAELDSVKRLTCGFSKELEEREKYLDSLKRTSEEFLDKLEMKEKQLEEHVKEFEIKERQLDSMQKSVEELCKQVELKEKQLDSDFHSRTMIVQPENLMGNNTVNGLTEGLRCCITVNGRDLQLLLNEHLRKHDLIHNEVFTAIRKSSDPGKLILDAMQGFYPPCLKKGDIEFDLSVIRRSCTTFLEQLIKISPWIRPEIREDAMKLAREWKSRMRAVPENTLEVLGFLQLLAAFKLASYFSSDELQRLLDIVTQCRQAPELCEALGIAESLPGSHISSPHLNIEQTDHLDVSDLAHSSSANCGATIDEMSSPLILDEDINVDDLNSYEILAALKMSPDPAKLVLDMMQGSYSQHSKNKGAALDASVVRSEILLLGQLMKVSPIISPLVKAEAVKLALSWKANIRLDTENILEVWAFLLFVAIYGFVSIFRRDEIFKLLLPVAHYRQAPEICRILVGFTAKVPVPELIQHLIVRKQHIEAVRFSYVLGLIDKFPPELILKQYLENTRITCAGISKNEKDLPKAQGEAIDKEVGALRSILQCVVEFKLESRFMTWNIIGHIAELEKRKASGISSSKAPALIVPQHHGGNYDTLGISCHRDKQSPVPAVHQQLHNPSLSHGLKLQWNNKRRRIYVSADRPYSSQVPTQSVHNEVINLDEEKERAKEFELKVKLFEEKEKQIEIKERKLMERIKEFELKENTHVMTEKSDFIQGLIKSNRHIEAIKYIYKLKMVDKFPPACLLHDHLSYLKKNARKLRKKKNNPIAAQIGSIAKEIAGLRKVTKCIATYGLEYEFSPKNLKERIAGLEKKMAEKTREIESSNVKVRRLTTSKDKVLQQHNKKKNFICSSFATPAPIKIISPFALPENSGPRVGNRSRTFLRQKQHISFKEKFVDDDFVVPPPKRSRGNSSSNVNDVQMKATCMDGGVPKEDVSAGSDASVLNRNNKEDKQKASSSSEERSPNKKTKSGNSKAEGEEASMPEREGIKSENDDERSNFDTSELDPNQKVFVCADPDFNNFERERAEISFAVNQLWAVYDSLDGMPRFYARIRKVLRPGFKLQITWFEPIPDKEAEQQWHDEALPVGCGRVEYGDTEETVDRLMFSHRMDCVTGGHRSMYYIYPKKGETWALFKDWDVKWSLEPDKHRPPYEFQFVEVVTDFIEDYGIGVAYLAKVKEFVSIFERVYYRDEVVSFCIRSSELYRFSHRVPSVRMSGKEGKGVPAMSFELDTAAMPSNFASVVDTEIILKKSGGGPNKGTSALGRSISPMRGSNSSGCEVVEVEVYDFKKKKSEEKYKLGEIWAVYSDKDGLPRKYVQVKKIESTNGFRVHVAILETGTLQKDPRRSASCGTFRVKHGKPVMLLTNAFSQKVIAKSTGRNTYEIYPRQGEIWAIYKNFNSELTCSDEETEECDIVEVVEDNSSSVKVVVLMPAKGLDNFYMSPTLKRLKSSRMEIPRSEFSRFSHKCLAYRHVGEIDSRTRGYWQLDPSSIRGSVILLE